MCASSSRSGGKDQRTPSCAGGRCRNATVSLYHRTSIRSSLRVQARTHARHGRQFAVLCICLCFIWRRVINATSADDSHLYRKRHVAYWLLLEEASGSENVLDAFLRFSHVASYKISFASCSLTRADVNAHCTRYALLYKVLSQIDSGSMMNSCKFHLLVFYTQIKLNWVVYFKK